MGAPPKARPSVAHVLSPAQRRQFATLLHSWYRSHARDLPWRNIADPYQTWVSEIMLQQTRVGAVVDHFRDFLSRFPTVLSLALAREDDVLAAWSGLGYYRRARMLHRAAQFLAAEHNGVLPNTAAQLRRLPGVGVYTSAAIASIAFGERIAVVDGNVERVLLRIAGREDDGTQKVADFVGSLASLLMPGDRSSIAPGDHNQAMMELGATICLPRNPLCMQCPVVALCRTRGEHPAPRRAPMRSERACFGLVTRKQRDSAHVEVLLHRRPAHLSLMPGMLQLPPIEQPPAAEPEPLLRLRHSIVGTNFYVEVFALKDRSTARRMCSDADPELLWLRCTELRRHPLTGLARKTLQRLSLMPAPMDEGASAPLPLLIGRHNRVGMDAAAQPAPQPRRRIQLP